MAYVSTYREVDPLLSVDLSNPTAPQLRGALVVPGFANYLHPVGNDFLIAFGRDDRSPTGEIGAPQVSLFYVGDPDNPRLADRMTMRGASGTASEAFGDHHAVAYFAEYGLLSLPIDWRSGQQRHSAAWVFDVDVDAASGEGSLAYSGRIDHDFAVRRSLRIEDALVTVSAGELKTHSIDDVGALRGSLYFADPLAADQFNVREDSGATTLDVLANDHVGPNARIAEVVYDGDDAELAIADDGRSLVFTPAADFFGYVAARYAVDVPGRGRREATVSVYVEGVDDAPRPADDAFEVIAGQADVALDVLANDVDPDRGGGIVIHPIYDGQPAFRIGATYAVDNAAVTAGWNAPEATVTFAEALTIRPPHLYGPLRVVHVSAASQGGTVTITEAGDKVLYTPAAGFAGAETFTYRVQAANGLTAEAVVTVSVALPASDPPVNEPAGNRDALRLAAIERRVRYREVDARTDRPPVMQGIRASSPTGRRIARDAVGAAHDAALRAMTAERHVARRQGVVAGPTQPTAQAAVAPLVAAARRSDD
jgi:hypothetical protein